MVTTLDVISGGRAILGIGAAWYEEEHEGLGFTYPPVRERMERLDEALRVCRAMFTEDVPSFDGTHYRIDGAKNLPRPIQPSGPPILVGGSGEKRTLRLVARHADMCNIHGSPATVRRLLGVLHGHCAEVGRDPAEITTTRLGTLMLADTEKEAEQTSSALREMAGPDFEERFTVGTEAGIVDQVGALVDAGLDCLIFNMPFASEEQVHRAGELLTARFG
jgi:alkanesulfonate monooxygenase SsuD/methylene tetrahydromethanopterin reductase-like flavin-dependent oxidoreductase (luciferase family)